jgi:hypothetical protein
MVPPALTSSSSQHLHASSACFVARHGHFIYYKGHPFYAVSVLVHSNVEQHGKRLLRKAQMPPESEAATEGGRKELHARLAEAGLPLFGLLPRDPLVASVRLDEIQAALSARTVADSASQPDAAIDKVRYLTPSWVSFHLQRMHMHQHHVSSVNPCYMLVRGQGGTSDLLTRPLYGQTSR